MADRPHIIVLFWDNLGWGEVVNPDHRPEGRGGLAVEHHQAVLLGSDTAADSYVNETNSSH